MKKIKYLPFIFLLACATRTEPKEHLTMIQIVDRQGFSETISAEDRLHRYEGVDFSLSQPYQRVTRVFSTRRSELTSYHSNGQLKQFLEVKNGRARGKYLEYYDNGQKKIEGTVIEGVGDLAEGSLATFVFDQMTRAWDRSGNIQAEVPYAKGFLQGRALYYYPSGEIFQMAEYEQNLPHGEFVEYREDGAVFFNEEYSFGLLINGTYPDGKVIKQQGVKAIYEKGKLVKTVQVTDGLLNGNVFCFDEKGSMVGRYHLVDQARHGEEWIYYKTNLPKMLINWYMDKMQGVVKTWYENGALQSEKEMVDNHKQGPSVVWYPNGEVLMVEEYERGDLVKGSYFSKGKKEPVSKVVGGTGVATIFNEQGQIVKKIKYDRGRIVHDRHN
jgi:antitoxin component YwqK of YwqJK toxin-antitoxin module